MASIFLALPNAGSICPDAFVSVQLATLALKPDGSRLHRVEIRGRAFSAVTGNFNLLWCDALNMRREKKLTHYSMMHSDISTIPGWLDVLVEEMQRVGADILSCIIPIKDMRGVTSTGVHMGRGTQDSIRRFTMKEVIEELPETFSIKDIGPMWKGSPAVSLAVNNGLWICDFTKPWVQRVVFSMSDWIHREPVEGVEPGIDEDGFETGMTYHMGIDTDDWKFSRWAQNVEGLKVFATRKIPIGHIGPMEFRNDLVWGTQASDMGD